MTDGPEQDLFDDPGVTRRGLIRLGTGIAGLTVLSGSVANAQRVLREEPEFRAAAFLAGPEDARPEPASGFFDGKTEAYYIYIATDTGGRWEIDTEESDAWSLLSQKLEQVNFIPRDVRNVTSAAQGHIAHHNGSGVVSSGFYYYNGSHWGPLTATTFSYTGDGKTDRTIAADFQFERVIVEDSGGKAVDAYTTLSNGAMSNNSFSGNLAVNSSGGFTVGDNGADADPNADGENYEVYAE